MKLFKQVTALILGLVMLIALAPAYAFPVQADSSVYYEDDFSTSDKYTAALGSYITNPAVYDETNQALLFNSVSGHQASVFMGLDNAASMTNYTISADFRFTDETCSLGGVSAYCISNGNGYELAIYKGALRLYRRVSGGNDTLKSDTDLNSYFPDYAVGDTVRLSLTAVTNTTGGVTLLAKATYNKETIVFAGITDFSEYAPLKGAPGIRGGANNSTVSVDCYVDNLSVVAYTGDIAQELTDEFGYVIDPILNIGSDPTQRNIVWQAPATFECSVQLAKASDVENGEFPAQYTSVAATAHSTTNGFISYKTTLTGLAADTEYVYRILCGDYTSQLYYFSTGDTDNGYTYSFVGDPQVNRKTGDVDGWEATLTAISNNFNPEFLLSLGDEVHAPSALSYGSFISDQLTELTTATLIGNHDTSAMYSDYFYMPNESTQYGITAAGGNYWFVYGNTLYMCLNSNDSSIEEHTAFMEAAIAANPDVVWKVVALHHCIYSVGFHAFDDDVLALREGLVPVFTELDMDLVLMGHDHTYTRTYIMDGFEAESENGVQYSATDPDGILYITASSSSGSKYNTYNTSQDSTSYTAVYSVEECTTFAIVEVTDYSYSIVTYYTDTLEVMDHFTLYKTVLPEGVTQIGAGAFAGSEELTSVTIPSTVTAIGAGAFEDCTNLTDVYISDWEAWNNISFADETANPLYYAGNLYLNGEPVATSITEDVIFGQKLMTLDADLSLDFYVAISEEIADGEAASILLQIGETSQTVSLKDVPQEFLFADVTGDGVAEWYSWHIITADVPVKDITKSITLQLVDSDGNVGDSYSYTVKQYADYLLQNSDDADTKAVAQALLDYGAAAEKYFTVRNNGTVEDSSLANGGDFGDRLGDITVPSTYHPSKTDDITDIVSYGTSLILEESTSIRLYFQASSDIWSNTQVSVDVIGAEYTSKQLNSGYSYVEITGIHAIDLNTVYTVTVTSGDESIQVSYCGLSYVWAVLNNSTNENLTQMVKALYRYWQAAEAYAMGSPESGNDEFEILPL